VLIDWFTVGAQALNFAVLVWLMRHFLYRPVQDAIASREKAIADTLADAQARQAQAQKDKDDFQHRSDEFEQHRAGLLAQATHEAGAERQRLVDAAHQAADALSASRQAELAREAQSLHQALGTSASQAVFEVARKALADITGVALEARACEVFVQRLRGLAGTEHAALAAALQAGGQRARVRSAFDLPAAQREAVQKAVDDSFGNTVALQFDTAANLVAGIELSAQGHKFAWSIGDCLTALDRDVAALLRTAPAAA
jgi:F-type H+-transporting ATPase subunit b